MHFAGLGRWQLKMRFSVQLRRLRGADADADTDKQTELFFSSRPRADVFVYSSLIVIEFKCLVSNKNRF